MKVSRSPCAGTETDGWCCGAAGSCCPTPTSTVAEPLTAPTASKLNWLRAAVLGASDGIVSVASVVVGVGAATTSMKAVVLPALAILVGGALSMAAGEWASVWTQRDGQLALVKRKLFQHADLAKPWQSALASMLSFAGWGSIPLLTAAFSAWAWRLLFVGSAALAALFLAGFLAAWESDGPTGKGMARTVIGGVIAMAVTYGIGRLAGVAGL